MTCMCSIINRPLLFQRDFGEHWTAFCCLLCTLDILDIPLSGVHTLARDAARQVVGKSELPVPNLYPVLVIDTLFATKRYSWNFRPCLNSHFMTLKGVISSTQLGCIHYLLHLGIMQPWSVASWYHLGSCKHHSL